MSVELTGYEVEVLERMFKKELREAKLYDTVVAVASLRNKILGEKIYSREIYLDLEQPQHSDIGILMGRYIYGRFYYLVRCRGYQANGGSNSLSVRDTEDNIKAWIQLLKESKIPNVHIFTDFVEEKLQKALQR